jgi:hypothetical protein
MTLPALAPCCENTMPRKAGRRCGALLDRSGAAFDRARARARARARGKAEDEAENRAIRARLRHHTCRRPALTNGRCKWHGGKSTGPVTQGTANTIDAMVKGRHAWLAERKAAGLPLTMGRKPGGRNRSREQIEAEKQAKADARALRRVQHQARMEKQERKQAQRDEDAQLEARRKAFHNGQPFFVEPDIPDGLLDAALAAIAGPVTARELDQLLRVEDLFLKRLGGRNPLGEMAARAHFKRLVRIEQAIGGEDGRDRIAALKQAFSDFELRCATARTMDIIKGASRA